MDDQQLFFEDLTDALREAVRVCGGMKVVGGKLWPEKSPETAGRLLSDCLNPHRAERLNPEQLMLVRKRSINRLLALGVVAEQSAVQAALRSIRQGSSAA